MTSQPAANESGGYELLDVVEEYTAPEGVKLKVPDGFLKLAVLATVEDAIDPSFNEGATVDEQIEVSALVSAEGYGLPTERELITSIAHRVMRDSRMAHIVPTLSERFRRE